MALGNAIQPRLRKTWVEGHFAAFAKLCVMGVGISTGFALLGYAFCWLFGKWFLGLVYGPEFSAANPLLMLMALLAIFQYGQNITNFAVQATRFFWARVPIYFVSLVATVVAAWILIPLYGLEGAAWSVGLHGLISMSLNLAVLVFSYVRRKNSQ